MLPFNLDSVLQPAADSKGAAEQLEHLQHDKKKKKSSRPRSPVPDDVLEANALPLCASVILMIRWIIFLPRPRQKFASLDKRSVSRHTRSTQRPASPLDSTFSSHVNNILCRPSPPSPAVLPGTSVNSSQSEYTFRQSRLYCTLALLASLFFTKGEQEAVQAIALPPGPGPGGDEHELFRVRIHRGDLGDAAAVVMRIHPEKFLQGWELVAVP